jgi:hypothetical protein
MKQIKLTFLALILSYSALLAQVDHWESVVLPGNSWQYLVPNSQPDISWKQLGFNDTSWSTGLSGIGYGDDDDATIIAPSISLYMRKQFNITTINEIEAVLLDMDFDDGFVAYLNGTEIARSLVSGVVPSFNQYADADHEALLYRGIDPERFEIDKNLLIEGSNILAIEIHNWDASSSDMTSIPTVSLGINSTNYNYAPVPDWFDEPFYFQEVILESSNLPIVIIETTGGQEIPNEPKISATMTIIDNGSGARNFVSDASNLNSLDYDGAIQIEYRGSTSSFLPKKQYALTTYDLVGQKDNVSLLGMPVENDWILNGFAYDPSLMRDYISYQLSLKIGQYASRGVYCEVILNGDYQGLYVLQEKLKADDNRIDINKIEPGDNSGDNLTGGYITKADKAEGSDEAAWWMESYVEGYFTAFIHEHPKPTTVSFQQNNYIQDQFFNLSGAAASKNVSLAYGYPSIIDIPSFIDFMIINELASNVDAYQFSTFFHKDRNGKLRAGPVWDFNLTFGNDLFEWGYDRSLTGVWQFDDGGNVGARFWKDLYDDPIFRCYLSKRWLALTEAGQPLHRDQINLLIDDVVVRISEALERENMRWGTIGDHEAHIIAMKQWLNERIEWMTRELQSSAGCSMPALPELVISKINYHPMTADGTGEKDREFIEITNNGDEVADLTGVYIGGTGLVYQFPAFFQLASGSTVMLANNTEAFIGTYGYEPTDEFSRSLSNSGQRIALLNGFGTVIDEVTYSDSVPWPLAADGDGFFLELIDLALDNNDPQNWQASQFVQTSVPDPTIGRTISIYPNPARDNITIRAESKIEMIKVYDLNGRLKIAVSSDSTEQKLSLSGLNKSVYLIDIQTVTGFYTEKLIISY